MFKKLLKAIRQFEGFTLVELMIVITVIAILATIAVASYTRIQAGARDARRKGDLRALATALQLYFTEMASYPANLATLTPTYIPTVPIPPVPTLQSAYSYNQGTGVNVGKFSLCAVMETAGASYWVVSTANIGGYTNTTCPAAE